MKKSFLTFLVFILISLGILYGLNKQQKSLQPEEHEVLVRLVLVDVIAVDKKGDFATDLTKDDFEIYEDGKRIPIDSLELISLKEPEFEIPEIEEIKVTDVPGRKKRFFVIFDSINTIKRMLDRSRNRIIEKLVSLVKLGEEIMILELDDKKGMNILQHFTSDEELIAQAVNKASGNIWIEKSSETLSTPGILLRPESGKHQRSDTAISRFQEFSRYAYQFETRVRFEKTINSLLTLLNMIKDYPGRKPVLYISGGMPALSFEELYSSRNIDVAIARSEVAASKVLDPFRVLQKSGRRGGQSIINDLIHFANSHNITFYSLDPDNYLKYVLPDIAFDNFPRQVDVAEIKLNELTNLKFLALDTGGEAMHGANKFEYFQKIIDRDLTYYYELSYYPERDKVDGKYHKIKVKVNKPGIKIRFRKGYYDYSDEQRESLIFASASYNPSLFNQIPFDARVVPFINRKNECILWMNLALPVQELILGDSDAREMKILKLNMWVEDIKKEDTFSTQVNIPFVLTPSFRDRLKNSKYFGYNTRSQRLKLKKDKYRVIFALYDESRGEIGTVEQMLDMPSLKDEKDPRVISAIFGQLVESKKGGIKPFSISQQDGTLQVSQFKFYPLGLNQFKRRKDISLFLQVYSPQKKVAFKPRFSLIQNSKEQGILLSEVMDESFNKKAGIWNVVFKLNFEGFSEGDYTLRIGLTDSSTNQGIEKKLQIKIL
ncbi:MAG: VWA domain-containing protein [Candidatus Aminicenantes bacterium]|nr:VWA domain-containing protein [Candidatus Aminicenantes bacterium]